MSCSRTPNRCRPESHPSLPPAPRGRYVTEDGGPDEDGNARVQKFSPQYQFLLKVGGPGSGNLQVRCRTLRLVATAGGWRSLPCRPPPSSLPACKGVWRGVAGHAVAVACGMCCEASSRGGRGGPAPGSARLPAALATCPGAVFLVRQATCRSSALPGSRA